MAENNFALLKERFDYLTERDSADHLAVNCPVDRFIELVTALRDELGYDLLLDVTAVDWDVDSPRFTGIYHILSTTHHEYIRIAVDCVDDIHPSLPSLTGLYAAANWHERETYDLMGIHYEGHPNLKRIPMGRLSVPPLAQGISAGGDRNTTATDDVAEQTNTKVLPAPMMGGSFVSSAIDP